MVKAIDVYIHIFNQYSVFSTNITFCSLREALYVQDGLPLLYLFRQLPDKDQPLETALSTKADPALKYAYISISLYGLNFGTINGHWSMIRS